VKVAAVLSKVSLAKVFCCDVPLPRVDGVKKNIFEAAEAPVPLPLKMVRSPPIASVPVAAAERRT
jgi:hypothetical protein